jgi:hypothetical protein
MQCSIRFDRAIVGHAKGMVCVGLRVASRVEDEVVPVLPNRGSFVRSNRAGCDRVLLVGVPVGRDGTSANVAGTYAGSSTAQVGAPATRA